MPNPLFMCPGDFSSFFSPQWSQHRTVPRVPACAQTHSHAPHVENVVLAQVNCFRRKDQRLEGVVFGVFCACGLLLGGINAELKRRGGRSLAAVHVDAYYPVVYVYNRYLSTYLLSEWMGGGGRALDNRF